MPLSDAVVGILRRAALTLGAVVALACAAAIGGALARPVEPPPIAASRRPSAGPTSWPIADASDAGVAVPIEEVATDDDGTWDPEQDGAFDALRARFCVPAAAMIAAAGEDCGCGDGRGDAEAECERWIVRWYTAEALVLDPIAIDACLQVISEAASRCSVVTPAACAELAHVPARLGEPCGARSFACADGTSCDGERCVRPSCATGCPSGTFCDEDGSCRAYLLAGERCDVVDLGEGTLEPCARPFVCVGGRCREPLPIGARCERTAECAIGASCEDGRCVDRRLECAPEGCGRGYDCEGERGERCLRDGPWPLPRAGEACEEWCEPPAWCQRGRCVRGACRYSDGEPCTWVREGGQLGDDRFCESGLVPYEGRCARAAELHDDCRDGPGCGVGLHCGEAWTSGRCVAEACDPEAWFSG